MTYNVRYFANLAPVKGAASTRRGIQAVARALAILPELPHVVCLQEVEARSLRSKLSHSPTVSTETQIESFMGRLQAELDHAHRNLGYRAHYFPAHTYQVAGAKIYTTGLAILTRGDVEVRLDAPDGHDITNRPKNRLGQWLKQTRICAHITVRIPGGDSVDIFNTHLSLPNLVSSKVHQTAKRMGYGANQQLEIEALATYVSKQRRSDRFLVMGDFNALPGSPAYDMARDLLGADDAFAQMVGLPTHDLRSQWPTAGFLKFRMRLDHVFAGPGLRALDFDDTHAFGEQGRWHELSDHVPIVARFDTQAPTFIGA